MKRILLFMFLVTTILVVSCVQDYEEFNPPQALNGPFFEMSAGGDVIQTEENGNFLAEEQTLILTLSVIDCPGKIDSVAIAPTIAGLGTASVDEASLQAARGQTSGEIMVMYQVSPGLEEEIDITLNVTLWDGQEPIDWYGREVEYRKSSEKSYDVTLVTCTSTGLAGTYSSIADGDFGDGDGGSDGTYTDLESEVTFTEIRPGLYEVDDMSFGLYPEGYDDTAPEGSVDLCGTTISDRGDTDQYGDPFTISGTLNGDGTVDVTWSNTYGDGGTVTLTPQ